MSEQKSTLWFFTHCSAITAIYIGRELLNTLYCISIWVAARYAPHNPFFLIFLLHGLQYYYRYMRSVFYLDHIGRYSMLVTTALLLFVA